MGAGVTIETALTEAQQNYLNGQGEQSSPFTSTKRAVGGLQLGTLLEAIRASTYDVNDLHFDAATELTIASGAVTVTQSVHTIDTEGDAASDNLDTLSGLVAETLYILRPASAARTVVIRHAADNIRCPTGQNISLAEATDYAMIYSPNGTTAIVLAASTLAPGTLLRDLIDEFTASTGISLLKALRLQGGGAFSKQTMAGNRVLTIADPQFLRLDPNGVNRVVELPVVASSDGLFYVISNEADADGELISINTPTGPATIYVLDPRELVIVACDGAAWEFIGRSLTDFGARGLETDNLQESTAGAGISLASGTEIIGVSKVVSAAVAFDTATGTLFSVPAGETWLIEDAWFQTGVDWDGNGAFVLGDASDANGYLDAANAALRTTYDESGGIAGWTTGSYGLDSANRGAYLTRPVTLNPLKRRLVGAAVLTLTNTPGTSTAGSGTMFMRYTRLA